MKNKILKAIMLGIACLMVVIISTVGGYVLYVTNQYYRIDDNFAVTVENNSAEALEISDTFSLITYNIGFGAYNTDFSFFMDTGVMKDGTPVAGTLSKAVSKEVVLTNTNGAIAAVNSYDADFYFFQEVDTDSTRSWHVNQYDMLSGLGAEYSKSYAVNFHSAYLAYPLNDFHGQVLSGITTLSKYNLESSTRRSFPVDPSFPAKYFDLDRCFMVTRIALGNGHELVLINVHMSAYDKGGTIRAQQLAMLNSVLAEEYEAGNYVIAGGDFNHDIAGSINTFPTEQLVPEWVFELANSDLAEHFSFASAINAPTCRSTDMAYTEGVNYTVVIDGFIVSDNVSVLSVENIDTGFSYSDHNPVKLSFTFD